ncbi:MAG: O-antigen ligase family protein [Candidatus Omnitrophica bacterium]|nr:O-antigen ligase family protein [Candidatus Omnitrophota bacterium]
MQNPIKKIILFILFFLLAFSSIRLITLCKISYFDFIPFFIIFILLIIKKPIFVFMLLIFFGYIETFTLILPTRFVTINIILIFLCLFVFLLRNAVYRKKILFKKELLPVFLLLILTSFSLFFAIDFEVSYVKVTRLISCLILCFLAFNIVETKKDLYLVFFTIVGAALFLGINGILFSKELMEKDVFRISARGWDPNCFGITCASIIPLCFGLYRTSKRIFMVKLIVLAVVGLMFVVIYLTASRAAFVVTMMGIILLLFRRLLSFKILFLFIFLILIIIPRLPEYHLKRLLVLPGLEQHIRLSEDSPEISTKDRLHTLKDGLFNVFARNPLFGVGIGNYNYYSWWQRSPHNMYLGVAAELGIFGFFLFILIIINSFMDLRINKEKAIKDVRILSEAVRISLIMFCLGGLSLDLEYTKAFWIILCLGSILKNISVTEDL